MREFGVDEAGKGPVLGSMFAAAVVVDPADLPEDVGDSKTIAPERRRELAATIREVADAVGVAEITVDRIDDDETDMNSLTVAAHVEALEGAVAGLDGEGAGPVAGPDADDPLSGYVDAGDTNAVRFERRVADGVDADLSVRGEHGADESYAVVGAASVVAKVERDAHVAALADEHGDLGSGYPSDPATREFLEKYVAREGALPPCARASWKTSQDVLADAAQASLREFEPDGGQRTDGGRPEARPTTLDEF
ncbi:ribonuclease HII [Halobacteriales archaeon QH_10_67_22]|nr:MAG: ribonuclease HII [Halobacteriales archaeon QH_10_67_22]